MSKIKITPNAMMPIVGIVLFSFVFIGGAYFVLSAGSQPKVNIANYSKVDKNKPIIEVGETSYDMGTIKVSDTKVKEFEVKNVGSKPLLLSEISSSCGCTSAQIIYKSTLSKTFSMHSQSDYVAQIEPNTSAIVKVVYMPFTMPVYGIVERQVFMSTNDPSKPKLEFNIKANVQK
jgi:hypothetical protein